MSKKKQPKKQSSHIEELLNTGTTILTAPTREALAEMVNEIPVEVKYGAGAVGRNSDTGIFSLRIDLIK